MRAQPNNSHSYTHTARKGLSIDYLPALFLAAAIVFLPLGPESSSLNALAIVFVSIVLEAIPFEGIARGALADVKPAAGYGGFNIVVETFAEDIGGSSWTPFLDFYDYHQTTGHYARMSFNDGFYYKAVPIPGAVWPLSPGLLGRRTR